MGIVPLTIIYSPFFREMPLSALQHLLHVVDENHEDSSLQFLQESSFFHRYFHTEDQAIQQIHRPRLLMMEFL